MCSSGHELFKTDELIKKSILIKDGNPARYHLQTTSDNLDESKSYRKITFGQRDLKKPHKTILMVGETGTGKTTLINTMINYMCGVQREDKIWFEVTDDQSDISVHNRTSIITVYGVYIQESSVDFSIIDTPGYGDTRAMVRDKDIADGLLSLCVSDDVVNTIDAVCHVIMADQTRLSDRQRYIFDAVQSLFGKDIQENIVLLFTHSSGRPPKNALMAVKEAKVKSAVNQKNQPIFFLFDNCQSMFELNEECDMILKQSWDLSCNGLKEFFKCVENLKPKALHNTQHVLLKRKQLQANISNLQLHVKVMEDKRQCLKQTQETLEVHRKNVKDDKNFEYNAEVSYKEKIPININICDLNTKATCCTVCEENCHYPGCWLAINPSWCEVMINNHCTVCPNKCQYSKHVKENKIYITKTKTEKRINEDLKNRFENKIGHVESVINQLKKDLETFEKKKIKLVIEAFHCVEVLEMIALKTDSLFTLQHIDFLIEKMKEINEPEKAEHLKNIKRRAEDTRRYIRYFIKTKYV